MRPRGWKTHPQGPILGSVHRIAKRLARPLAFVLIAAQLLLAVPAMAHAQVTAGAATQSHCQGMDMGMDNDSDQCPCCPDGANSMSDCLTSCTLIAAIVPTLQFDSVPAPTAQVYLEPARLTPTFSEPPLKPPPIA